MSSPDLSELYHPKARLELVEAVEYYRAISVQLARTFKDTYDWAIEEILEFPETSPLIPIANVEARRKNLGRFPYHVVYVIDPDAIYIYAVAQSHREPLYWLERLREPGRE
jgi:hypothetical protein